MVFREAPKLVFSGLTKAIGAPRDLEKNLEEQAYFEKGLDLAIPHSETEQLAVKKVVEVVAQSARPSNVTAVNEESQVQSSAENTEMRQRISEVLGDVNNQDTQYTPIKSLNTFNFDWKIKARITKKHQKKPWKNAKGAGCLLNVELIDSFGTQIVATFFNDVAERWDEGLKEGGVYLFSNGSVKIANQKYTSVKNDYCIVFDRNSDI